MSEIADRVRDEITKRQQVTDEILARAAAEERRYEAEAPGGSLLSSGARVSAEEPSRSPREDRERSEGGLGGASERITVILEAAEKAAAATRIAAEKAAAAILGEAHETAAQELDAARRRADQLALERVRMMSRLRDDLLEQAASVRHKSDALVEMLDVAIAELEETRETSAPEAAAPKPTTEPPPDRFEAVRARISDAIRSAGPAPPAPSLPRRPVKPPQRRKPLGEGVSEGARLLAAQMAFAGSGREEIETRLRNEFGIEQTGPIVDDVIDS